MAKHVPTRQILGYKLEINRTGEKGKWERVGFLFVSKLEASKYLSSNYNSAKRSRIQAIRLETRRLDGREDNQSGRGLTRQQLNAQFVSFQNRKAS